MYSYYIDFILSLFVVTSATNAGINYIFPELFCKLSIRFNSYFFRSVKR